MAMQNKAGVTKMDQTLADYIKRITEQEKKPAPIPTTNENNYEVWPEDQGDADHKRNPYSPV
jgi:hypothetical protein